MFSRLVFFLILSVLISSNVWADNSVGTLVVRPEHRAGSIEKYSQSVEVYDSEYIAKRNIKTIFELLHNVVGLNVKSNGNDGNIPSLFMRGGTSGTEVAVFIDGINITDPVNKTPRLSVIPVSSIDRVEVITGGASALYGEDAMSGVVNIITKKNDSGIVDISYNKGGSEASVPNFALYKGFVSGDWSASIGAERSQYFGDRKESDESDSFSTNTSVTYAKNDFSATAKYFSDFQDLFYPGSTTPGFDGHSLYKNSGMSFSVGLDKSTIGVDHNTYRYRDLTGGWGSQVYQQTLHYNHSFVGYGSDKYTFSAKALNLNDLSNKWKNNESSYGLSSVYSLGKFEIVPALRMVDNKEYGKATLYSAGVNYFLQDSLVFKFVNSKSYNNPSTYEYSYKSGNLDPEFVFENSYGFDFYGEDCLFSISGFNKNYNDMITNIGGDWGYSIPGAPIYVNAEKAVIAGFDLKFEKSFSNIWDMMATYTQINEAKNKSADTRLSFCPEKQLMIDNIIGNDDLNTFLTYRYKGDFYEGTDIRGDVSLWDAGLNINPCYVKVTNVFDKKYDNSNGYPAEGIRWTLGAKTEF